MRRVFAPKLYITYKYDFDTVKSNDYDLNLSPEEMSLFEIKQADNLLFHQIRRITGDADGCAKRIAFVDCKGKASDQEGLSRLVIDGFYVNGIHYVIGERSASMTRNSILSFIESSVSLEVSEAITMGAYPGSTVISKLMAYRGLCLSSCHCLDGFMPKMIVVPDYEVALPNQHVKYIYDRKTSFVNDAGETVPWNQKDIADGYRDITIMPFDGCGIHHPAITEEVKMILASADDPTTILWRGPYLKGLTAEVDYPSFFAERGIRSVKDIWGVEHDVTPDAEPMIILSKSMFKGFKYYSKNGDASDWDYYWEQFVKYGHCLGVAKWNFNEDTEPVYTRCNYQVLQTLNLPYDQFADLATTSVEWAEKIVDGDPLYSMCFLGLTADRYDALNNYTKSILKNPIMLKQHEVRSYMVGLIQKYLDEMCAGKIWIKSCFKFLLPDLIAFMEAAAGVQVNGILDSDQFYCITKDGPLTGDKLITRNPHICDSENVILCGVNNRVTQKYLSHLSNTCIINAKSIVPQRLNGADFDGDLVLVFNDDRLMNGVDKNAIPVIDVDDKVTTTPEEFTPETRLKVTLRTMKNLIGEYSNYATAFRNKCGRTEEQRQKYMTYIDIISVLTGKSIDYAKTGVLYPMPRSISKYGRPLPYFMRYASPYYKKLKLSRSNSNMNRLCWDLEKWRTLLKFKKPDSRFDPSVMIDPSVPIPEDKLVRMEAIYKRFCLDVKELSEKYKSGPDDLRKKAYAILYDTYRSECRLVCNQDMKLIANIAVKLSTEHKSWNQKFKWIVGGPGIVQNIEQVDICLPERDDSGNLSYLGRRYKMTWIRKEDVQID